MKIKGTIKPKDIITYSDKEKVLELVSQLVFDSETGIYTPQRKEIGVVIGTANYLLENVEFNSNDNIYTDIYNNPDITNAINELLPTINDFIDSYLNSIVEYKKELYLHKNSSLEKQIINAIEKEIRDTTHNCTIHTINDKNTKKNSSNEFTK